VTTHARITEAQAEWFAQQFEVLTSAVETVIVGKRNAITLALIALFGEGHLLLEDVPGTGKTSLAKTIAQSLDGKWNRVQFTPDLLPADVTGSTIYNQARGIFEFHPGPVFANVVLGDEINRASPKTQSALLEVMEEHQVTVDGHPYPVPRPFIVIATQNPIELEGTYRLPEAQLDRFMMKMSIGYLSAALEMDLVMRRGQPSLNVPVVPVMSEETVVSMVQLAEQVHIEPSVASYAVSLVHATRKLSEVRLGVSSRGVLALVKAARVFAASSGRTFVIPDDIKYLAKPVLEHRLILTPEAEMRAIRPADLIERVLAEVTPPRRRSE
jgi:MoxR-like ATPase